MKNQNPSEKIIDFTDDDTLGMEIPDPDDLSNSIIMGCLVMLCLFAVFGVFCIVWLVFR